MDFLAGLNPPQQEAVRHVDGPLLILAGAGSGKTRVVTHRICNLICNHQVVPDSILAVTFTNKAAAEMRERAKALIGPKAARPLVVSTFHSLGVRLLREDGQRVGLKPQFSILDSDDVLGILKDAGGSTDNALARRWQWAISLWKNQGLNSAQVEPADDDERVAQRVMQRYEERLAAFQAVDFDDLIGLPVALLDVDPRTFNIDVNPAHETGLVPFDDGLGDTNFRLGTALGDGAIAINVSRGRPQTERKVAEEYAGVGCAAGGDRQSNPGAGVERHGVPVEFGPGGSIERVFADELIPVAR